VNCPVETDHAVELIKVSKSYRDGDAVIQAVDGVSLQVAPGEFVAVMGPSGSGKSTLLKIVGGLEDLTSGEVRIAGSNLSGMGRDRRAEMRRTAVGYVFQELNLLSALTARENVALPLELSGARRRAAASEALTVLDELGLGDKADRFPDDLSGGERQRVAIARALVGENRLLLADEPTGALDSLNGESIMSLIRGACTNGAAAIVVTHDAKLAAWADRVIFLRDGRIVDTTGTQSGPDSLLVAP